MHAYHAYHQECVLSRILNQERAGVYKREAWVHEPPMPAPFLVRGACRRGGGSFNITSGDLLEKKPRILEAVLLKLFIIIFF